jgi:hypothetical protein
MAFERQCDHQVTFNLPDSPPEMNQIVGRILYLYSSAYVEGETLPHAAPEDEKVMVWPVKGILMYNCPNGVFVYRETVAEAQRQLTEHCQRALDMVGADYRLEWRDENKKPALYLIRGRNH